MIAVENFSRKREHGENLSMPAKKAKKEHGKFAEKKQRYQKRGSTVLVEELYDKLEKKDRQLSSNLLREFSVEHIATTSGDELSFVLSKLLNGAVLTSFDALSSRILKILKQLLEKATDDQFVQFMEEFVKAENIESFFNRNDLDHKVLQVYTLALDRNCILPETISKNIIKTAKRCIVQSALTLSDAHKRVASLNFTIANALREITKEDVVKSCEKFLCKYSVDRDSRVRSVAIQGLSFLSESGYFLSKSSYTSVKNILNDVDSEIRIQALRLLLHFANKRPMEHTTIGAKKTQISMSDDAFTAVCDAMNDQNIAVRAEAARILGDFVDVSEALLFQTLDKKMMKTNKTTGLVQKVERSQFSLGGQPRERRWRFQPKEMRQDEHRGGWSRGKELHAPCPDRDREEDEEDSIIPHGACGAFVSALEDEFMDVRKAAVYSLGRLAQSRPTFAVSALEYLADMFNDEIAEVRLDAIKALSVLISHGQLDVEQLGVMLKCLDDAMPDSRQAMRELLGKATLVDVKCVEMCVKALLKCLERFPRDETEIFECMAKIGENHAVYVQSLARKLLDLNSMFHAREQLLENVQYMAKLIMVLNAASRQENIVTFLPPYVQKHYRYLRGSSVKLVKVIKCLETDSRRTATVQSTGAKAEQIVVDAYERLRQSESGDDLQARNQQKIDILRDVRAICKYNEEVSGVARLVCFLADISMAVDNVYSTILFGGQISDSFTALKQHLQDIENVEYQVTGLNDSIIGYILHCKIFLKMLQLIVAQLVDPATTSANRLVAQKIMESARSSLNSIISPGDELHQLVEDLEELFVEDALKEDRKKVATNPVICGVLSKKVPRLPEEFPHADEVSLKWAQITSPSKDTALENTIRFVAGLPHAVQLEATLHNFTENDCANLRIRVYSPDGESVYSVPLPKDFRTVGKVRYLTTQVMITAAKPWSDPAEVALTLVLQQSEHGRSFTPLLSCPSSSTPASIRVKIHPVSKSLM